MAIFPTFHKVVPTNLLSVPITVTLMQYAPRSLIQTKVSYAFRIVPWAFKKVEYSMTLVKHALVGPITLYGTSTNANCGPIAPLASTSLRTAQVPLTVYVPAA